MSYSHAYYPKLLTVIFVIFILTTFLPGNTPSANFPRENAVVKAIKRVSPAVVNISSQYEVVERPNPFFDFGLDPFFESFFKDFFEPNYQRRYKRNSLGSGVIIDGKRGYILTNEHVIARSAKIKVTLKDEREFEAELVGAAPDFDLAVLCIHSKEPLPAIQMGNSDDLMIGETVIAIGNPFGFSNTVTTGVISALNRSIQAENRTYRDFIQTDASINPGNSGGPLLNINGELIGINTAIYSKAQGIGFAIPINKARRVIDDLVKYGEVHIPWLGLFVQDLDPRLARYFSVPEEKGVLVAEVTDQSPARKAGLRPGDIITFAGNKRVASKQEYYAAIRDFVAGDVIPITIWKDSKAYVAQPGSQIFPEALAEDLVYNLLGVRMAKISTALRLKFRVSAKSGVILTDLRPNSYLHEIGARPGDVIRKINEITVNTLDHFNKGIIRYRQRESVVLLIQRGKQQYYVIVKINA